MRSAGHNFLALATSNIAPVVEPELSSFWADLRQHLTELSLEVQEAHLDISKVPDLGVLGTLTALKNLKVDCACDLSGMELALKLPHLASLKLRSLKNGRLVLLCPKLTKAIIEGTSKLHIAMEDSALVDLELSECSKVSVGLCSPDEQLQGLKSLSVLDSTEIGKRLIDDVGPMRNLQTLQYGKLPEACIPRSLPQSMQNLRLSVIDPSSNLPRGWGPDLKVTSFWSDQGGKAWDTNSAKPLAELLAMHSMSPLKRSALNRFVTCMNGGGLEAMSIFRRQEFCDSSLYMTRLVTMTKVDICK